MKPGKPKVKKKLAADAVSARVLMPGRSISIRVKFPIYRLVGLVGPAAHYRTTTQCSDIADQAADSDNNNQ